MPQLIQSQARGLLALLTAKTGGIGPPAFEDYLRLTLETRDFYSLNGRQTLFRAQSAAQLDNAATGWIGAGGAPATGWFPCCGTVAPAPPPAGSDIIVPEGEIWRVLGVTFQFERTTGSGGSLAAGWAFGTFPVWCFIQTNGPISGTVGTGFRGTAGGMTDFLALPGSSPAFFVPQFDLGTLDFNLEVNVSYERIPL